MSQKIKGLLFAFLVVFVSAELLWASTRTDWRAIFKGVEHATGFTDTPRLQQVNAVRIDLAEPKISFIATTSNGSEPNDTTRETAEEFLSKTDTQLCINTMFYSKNKTDSNYAELEGLSITRGQIVSKETVMPPRSLAILITKDNELKLEPNSTDCNTADVWTSIECWPRLLEDGKNIGKDIGDPAIDAVHPRSAAGASRDNRYLILITIDGRQTGYSEGATFAETADWLKEFGAYNGVNLDGGGSTHLWINDANTIRALNKPSENRAVGSHLGVYAPALLKSKAE